MAKWRCEFAGPEAEVERLDQLSGEREVRASRAAAWTVLHDLRRAAARKLRGGPRRLEAARPARRKAACRESSGSPFAPAPAPLGEREPSVLLLLHDVQLHGAIRSWNSRTERGRAPVRGSPAEARATRSPWSRLASASELNDHMVRTEHLRQQIVPEYVRIRGCRASRSAEFGEFDADHRSDAGCSRNRFSPGRTEPCRSCRSWMFRIFGSGGESRMSSKLGVIPNDSRGCASIPTNPPGTDRDALRRRRFAGRGSRRGVSLESSPPFSFRSIRSACILVPRASRRFQGNSAS